MTIKNKLKARWNNESPSFWKKVQKVGIVCAALGGAIATAPISLPAAAVTVSGYLATAGVVAGILAKLTVADSSVLEDTPVVEEKN